jgi:hypothetical protein
VPIDAGGWLNITIDTGGVIATIVIAYWQHRHPDRGAHRAGRADLRRLLAEGESICEHVWRYGPLAEHQMVQLGAPDFAARAARSARRGPARLRPALAELAGMADELARSAAFPSELRRAIVQDWAARDLAAAIDRTRTDLATRKPR